MPPHLCRIGFRWSGGHRLVLADLRPLTVEECLVQDKRAIAAAERLNSLMENTSLRDLAAGSRLSESRFWHIFKQTYGVSPLQWLLDHRLAAAIEQLGATDLSVKEISFRAGFGSQSQFSRLFRKRYGQSPLQYRREARQQQERANLQQEMCQGNT